VLSNPSPRCGGTCLSIFTLRTPFFFSPFQLPFGPDLKAPFLHLVCPLFCSCGVYSFSGVPHANLNPGSGSFNFHETFRFFPPVVSPALIRLIGTFGTLTNGPPLKTVRPFVSSPSVRFRLLISRELGVDVTQRLLITAHPTLSPFFQIGRVWSRASWSSSLALAVRPPPPTALHTILAGFQGPVPIPPRFQPFFPRFPLTSSPL